MPLEKINLDEEFSKPEVRKAFLDWWVGNAKEPTRLQKDTELARKLFYSRFGHLCRSVVPGLQTVQDLFPGKTLDDSQYYCSWSDEHQEEECIYLLGRRIHGREFYLRVQPEVYLEKSTNGKAFKSLYVRIIYAPDAEEVKRWEEDLREHERLIAEIRLRGKPC